MDNTTYTDMAKACQLAETHALQLEGESLSKARQEAERSGLRQGSAAQAGLLRFMVRTLKADSIISVGTGAIVEALQLVAGLDGAGQLTAVDSSARGITIIRRIFSDLNDQEASHTTLRAVNTSPAAFLPRLNAESYDLIVVSGNASNYEPTFEQAHHLLKTGGRVAFADMAGVASGEPDKPQAMKALLGQIEEDDRFETVLTSLGTGLLVACKR
ncbi:methyltransferase [Bifidobacterium sp. ESL0763]|uniref:O-methyltransferase n=1 Tax=Bifidobacterium sp. ESL0763 TaxID=2983227 RepID=UPI0023F68ADB|nr:methyltransferase [Bifidobacterium sp. ESL0763]MDF7664039.1 methyltransferase [Bifidobacterium sp. ESL0763]